jgi:hypothetical protein
MIRRIMLFVALLAVTGMVWAQVYTEAQIRQRVPYSQMKAAMPSLTLEQYNLTVRTLAKQLASQAASPSQPNYLGNLSANPYSPNSTSNRFGTYGNPYSPKSINNPYGQYGNKFSPSGVANPYATSTPKLYGQDGQYLGKLSSNPYDPDSISNPYGRFGNRYSPTSINNPYSVYGNPYSPYSATNPYATKPPVIKKK